MAVAGVAAARIDLDAAPADRGADVGAPREADLAAPEALPMQLERVDASPFVEADQLRAAALFECRVLANKTLQASIGRPEQ